LSAQLAVVHDLKEWMQRRRSDEAGAALGILPQSCYVALKTLPRGGCLERSIGVRSLLRRQVLEGGIEKHCQEGGSPDIQICGRNRTI
jgi:hypothetical protein